MKAEDIRKLGEAIAHHAELLALLDYAEDDPIFVAERSQSLGLLKNARLIEAVDDDRYFTGEYYELLRKTIHTSNYEVNTMPDIQVWLADVSHLASQYAALETEQQDEERLAIRKSLVKTLFQMSMNLKSLIRDIDLRASSEFGYCKTLQAKIREGHYYRERTTDILKKLERLDYEALSNLSKHPDIELLTIGKFFNKIDVLRSELSLVLHKLQRLSTSFKETALRMRQFQRILYALNEHRLDTKTMLDRIEWDMVPLLNSVGADAMPRMMANFDYAQNTAFAQARFDDVAKKVKLPSIKQHQMTIQLPVLLEEDAPTDDDHTEDFTLDLLEHQQGFSRQLQAASQAVSVVSYWQNTSALQDQISVNAWLLEMSRWLSEVRVNLSAEQGRLEIELIEHQTLERSDIVTLSDVRAVYHTGQVM
jgi:hypothetical protein